MEVTRVPEGFLYFAKRMAGGALLNASGRQPWGLPALNALQNA